MKIEHTAYQVADPVSLAAWYTAHLGLRIKRSQAESPFGYFLADDGDSVMLEFYRQDAMAVPDYRAMDPMLLHLAFLADDVPAERARLIAAGSTPEGDAFRNAAGDEVAMLRDPWGLAIRAHPPRRTYDSGDFVPGPLTHSLAQLASRERHLGKSRLVSRGSRPDRPLALLRIRRAERTSESE